MGWTGAGCCGRGRGLELHPSPLWVLFWLPFTICGILAPQPGIEPRPLAVKAQSPNLWNSPGNSHLCGLNLDSLINLLVPERNWVEPQTLTPPPFAHSVRLDPSLGVFLEAHLPVRSLDQESGDLAMTEIHSQASHSTFCICFSHPQHGHPNVCLKIIILFSYRALSLCQAPFRHFPIFNYY